MAKRLLYIWLLIAICVSPLRAEVVVLRSGQQVKGEVLINNDDVVILRRKDGTRYQYPKTEVLSIQAEQPLATSVEATPQTRQQRMAVRVAAAGGAAYVPHMGWGGMADAHMMLGAHNLLDKQIFLGGSFGYRGVFQGDQGYSWLPLQLVLQYPIAQDATLRSRPLLGASFGYAFATKKRWGGGLCAGVDVGWWWRINATTSWSIACTAQWQQTHIDIVETIGSTNYLNHVGCNILGIGLKLGIQF